MIIEYFYKKYLSSKEWRSFRLKALENVERKGLYICQGCGWDFPVQRLDVHHKDYKHLYRETLKDVLVLCEQCHNKEDVKRARLAAARSARALDGAMFDGWADTVFGENWWEYYDYDVVRERYEVWAERKGNS